MAVTRRILTIGGASLLAACTRLGALNGLNAVVPGDGGVDKRATGIVYGNAPRQALDVYAPASASRLPVIIFFYGGSWANGDRGDYGFAARALAAQGFVVVVPDYRLVPEVVFPAFVEDGAKAVAWAVTNIVGFGGDPDRIAVCGHSAGAYIAAMLALDTRWMAAAGASGAVKAAVTLAGPFDFAPFVPGGAADAAFGSAANIAATQPITASRGDAPPMLLLTGDADTTVLPRNSRALAARITALGGVARLIEYPEVGHIGILLALSKPFRGKAQALADTVAFLKPALAAQSKSGIS